MSRKAEASAMGMAERAEGAAGRKKKAGPVVYCGPTVRGVAKQYTVFSGGIPEALEAITMRAMAPNPDNRYPSADAMLADLEEFRKNPNINLDHGPGDLPGDFLDDGERTQILNTAQVNAVRTGGRRELDHSSAGRSRGTSSGRRWEEDEEVEEEPRRRPNWPIIGAVAALIGGDAKNWQPIYDVSDPTIYGAASEGLKEVSHHSMFGGIMAILASAPFFLAGFETIPQGVEDAGGDITNVGKTVVLSVCLACVFYAILLFCFGYGWPWQEFAHMANPSASTMFLNLYPGAVGEVLYWLITLGAIAGLFTTWNGFFMSSAMLLMGMSRGLLMPKIFAKQNKNGIPVPGLIVCLGLSLIGPFLGAGLIGDITSFSGAAFVLSWGLTSYSLAFLRKKEPNLERPYKVPGGAAMGWFAGIVSTVVFILLFIPASPMYMKSTACIMFVGWMIIGLILYLAASGQRRGKSQTELKEGVFHGMEERKQA